MRSELAINAGAVSETQKSPLTVAGPAGFLHQIGPAVRTSPTDYNARSDAGLLGSAAGLAASVGFGAASCGIAGGGVSCRTPAV